MITQGKVKELFEYRDGSLYWRVRPAKTGAVKIGDFAGSIDGRGYIQIMFKGKFYLSHRLIYLYHHGYLPDYLDHIDRDKSNNDINNLRECSISENNKNCKIRRDNRSGVKGVCWHRASNKWVAQISVNGKRRHLGLFSDIKEAEKSMMSAREEFHGEFHSHD